NGGADAIKVHLNVDHRASGNDFGSLEKHYEFFEKLANEFDGPLGVVPGDSPLKISRTELEELEKMGFNYYSIYMKQMPTFMLDMELEKTAAVGPEHDPSSLK